MENSQLIDTKTLKIYPKNEQITRHRIHIPRQTSREPHLIHHLLIDYHLTVWRFNTPQPNKLFKPFRKLEIINSFSLYFDQLGNKEDVISRELSVRLRNLSSLKTLNLHLSRGYWLNLKGITHLSHALAELKGLSKMTLYLDSCSNLDDKCFRILFKNLKKHINLKDFDFDLSSSRNITEKTFKDLSSLLKHSLKYLEYFSFAMSDLVLFNGKPLDFLGSGLKNLTLLKKLKIAMTKLAISPLTDCSIFLSSLENLKSLRILDLDLSSLPKNLDMLQIFTTSLKYLINLRSLTLNLQNNSSFFVREMTVLARDLQSLTLLEILALDFRNSPKIYDRALEKLSEGIKPLIKLADFTLLFDQYSDFGDAVVENLIDGLENLPNLTSVNSSFKLCESVKSVYQNRLKINKNIEKIKFNVV